MTFPEELDRRSVAVAASRVAEVWLTQESELADKLIANMITVPADAIGEPQPDPYQLAMDQVRDAVLGMVQVPAQAAIQPGDVADALNRAGASSVYRDVVISTPFAVAVVDLLTDDAAAWVLRLADMVRDAMGREQ